MSIANNNQEDINNPLDDQSFSDTLIDYSEMIAESAFVGEYPFNTIKESIENQFNDYIDMDDRINYVDIFYEQLNNSYEIVRNDDGEEHPMEIIEALDKIKSSFIEMILELFDMRLMIHIQIEDLTSDDEIEFVIRRLYEFFILGARENFKTVISKDILAKVGNIESDKEYFKAIKDSLWNYSPLIICMGADRFLQLRGDNEIQYIFNENKATGNFLRKYSPKFYDNEEFEVEIINHITLLNQFKEEIINGTK